MSATATVKRVLNRRIRHRLYSFAQCLATLIETLLM
jgi:hypothetical protein